jgi:hypothetical protein
VARSLTDYALLDALADDLDRWTIFSAPSTALRWDGARRMAVHSAVKNSSVRFSERSRKISWKASRLHQINPSSSPADERS